MDWIGTIGAVSGIASLVLVIVLFIFRISRLESRVDIMWDIVTEEFKETISRRGGMNQHSAYTLTEQGLREFPEDVRKDLDEVKRRKGNPRIPTDKAIKELGGMRRLKQAIDGSDVSIGEIVAMIDVYLKQ